jgi:hypothetical protein
MQRKIAAFLATLTLASIAGVGLAPGEAEADRGRGRGYRARRYPAARRQYFAPRRGWRGYDKDDGGVSIGALLLGGAAAYGAYRLYERYDDNDD